MGIGSSPLVHKASCNVFEDLSVSRDESFLLKCKGEMIFFCFSAGVIHIGQACRDQLGLPS